MVFDVFERKMSSSVKLKPIQCALKFKPPILVLLYSDLATGKRRKRSMPLREFHSDTDVSSYATDLLKSPKHSKYVSIIPQEQLSALLRKLKDIHCGVATPPPPHHHLSTSTASTHKATTPTVTTTTTASSTRHQSSLLGIPPVTPASPSRETLKQFDNELDRLLDLDGGDIEEDDRLSDSLEDLLESAGQGGGGHKKESLSKGLFSNKESGVQGLTKLSDLPGLGSSAGGGVGGRARGTCVDVDPLVNVLNGSRKHSFDVQPLRPSTKESSLDKVPPVGGGKPRPEEGKTFSDANKKSANSHSLFKVSASKEKSDSRLPHQAGGTFATEVLDYSEDFESDSTGHRAMDNHGDADLDDRSLAISELLEDNVDDDGSLGLGLGEEKYFTGVKLSGSSSGDDLKRLNDIVTPPPLSDDDTHLPPLNSATSTSKASNHEDLNKVSDDYLAQVKGEMNTLFERNQIKPGDRDYVYDKEMDFDEPKIESGWDSDNSLSDF